MTIPCPRCATPLHEPLTDAIATTCQDCGHTMAVAYLLETVDLGRWQGWAGERLAWLHDRLVAGDLPAEGQGPAPSPPGAVSRAPLTSAAASSPLRPAQPSHPPASAGSLLLALGAFLLVVAGIAFLAFTWDLLGPFGQIGVLLLLGAACLTATDRLHLRLHGTATAIGVVGTLLVTIAAIGTRTLGPDVVGASGSLLLSVAICVALCVGAIQLRSGSAAVGELAGLAGSVTALTLVAAAPVDDALPLSEPWSWWVALSCGVGAVVVLGLADRVHLAGWPWVSAGFLVVGSISIAVFIEQLTDDVVVSDVDAVIVALSLVVAAVALAVSLRGSPHTVPVNVAVLVVWGLAVAIAGTSGLWTPGERPWAAGVVLVAGLAALLPRLLVVTPSWTRRTLALVGAMVIGAAVGLAVAPWLDPLDDYLTAAAWAGQAWPTWRGLVAGLAFVALLAGTAWLLPKWLAATPRTSEGAGKAAVSVGGAVLLPAAAALATWVFASLNDLDTATAGGGFYGYQAEPTPEVFQRQMVIALTVLALGVLVMVLLHRLPAWSVWAVPALAIPAALIRLDTLSIDASADPEVYGLALAIPAGVAAIGWWWLRRPQPTPTWQTMAPPFVLALAPSTTALLDETANRWFLSSDVGDEYQVRMVGLLAIGIAATVIGAWQRWGGLFFPGLALALVVVGIEFIDLGRSLPQWLAFAVAGAVLIAAGARWEWVRQRGRVGATWVRSLT